MVRHNRVLRNRHVGLSGRCGNLRAWTAWCAPNSLDAPGYKNVDASLFRDFQIYERMKFQFRGEATNVFNLVNLNAPGGNMSSPSSFGVISGAAGMRVLQVGGRFLF